ncbi:uncharacterized protein LOC144134127 [Amblyomma americanum]
MVTLCTALFIPDPVQYSKMLVLFASLFVAVFASNGNCNSGYVADTLLASSRRRASCDKAEQSCIGRLVCGMAFHGHRLDCRRELGGLTPGRCSVYCRQSLVSLASTEEGYAYIGCECGSDDFCSTLRLRLAPCWWNKPCPTSPATANATSGFQLPGGLTLISFSSSSPSATSLHLSKPLCSQLTQDCTSDPVCSVAWNYYRRFCQDVLDGVSQNCSTRCRNSVRVLVRMEKAHRLLDCACEGRGMGILCEKELSRIRRNCFRMDGVGPNHGGELPSAGVVLILAVLFQVVSSRSGR